MVDRYACGESSAVVAESCGIAKSTVLKILRAGGIEVSQATLADGRAHDR